jgi:O-antigen ligase
MKSRQNFAGFRPGSPLPQFIVLAFVAITAIVIGLIVGRGQWIIALGALGIPLVMLYPVQIGLGAFTVLIPFDQIAVLGQAEHGRTLTWFAGAAATAILLGTGLATRRLKLPPPETLWWVLFTLWYVITTAWAMNPDTALNFLPTVLGLLGLYLASVCFRYRESEIRGIAGLTILGGVAAAIWTIHLFRQGTFYETGVETRASLIVDGRYTNPDGLAMTLLLPISLAFGYFLSFKRWLAKACTLVAMAVVTLGLFVTMSRGAVVALAVMLLIFLYRMRAGAKLIGPVAVMALLLTLMPSGFFVRFQQAAESGGSGRLDIWRVGLAAFKHYGLFGAGLHNFPFAYTAYAGEAPHFKGINRDAHNIYLCIAVETGIVGLLLFAAAVRSQMRRCLPGDTNSEMNYLRIATEAATWAVLVFGLFGTILWDKAFWFSLMLMSATNRMAIASPKPLLSKGKNAGQRDQGFSPMRGGSPVVPPVLVRYR